MGEGERWVVGFAGKARHMFPQPVAKQRQGRKLTLWMALGVVPGYGGGVPFKEVLCFQYSWRYIERKICGGNQILVTKIEGDSEVFGL